MASPVLCVMLLALLAGVATSVPLSKSKVAVTNAKVTIKDGQSQTIRCTGPKKVVSIVEAAYTDPPPKSKASSPKNVKGTTACDSGTTSIGNTIRSLCKNKPTCFIQAEDPDSPDCRRPLVVEYQCTASVATPRIADDQMKKSAFIDELVDK